jgi:predicted P-loop ATPase
MKKNHLKLRKIESSIEFLFDLRYNMVSNEVECKEKNGAKWSTADENNIYRALHHTDIEASMPMLKIILGSNFVEVYNPLTKYFTDLNLTYPNSNKKDTIRQFVSYVNCQDPELFEQSLKHWMVSAIRCLFEKGSFNKTILTFYSSTQSTGKTSLARFLAPSQTDLLHFPVRLFIC